MTDAETPVIDPTKNVLDLMNFERIHRDSLRVSDEKLRLAELRRVDDLAAQKEVFDLRLSEMLRLQVTDNASNLASLVDRVTALLSERISKLEQFQYETSGKGAGVGMLISYLLTGAAVATAITMAVVRFHGP